MTEHTSEYFVVHDAIPKAQQDQIEKLTSDSRFPWFFSEGTILPDDIEQNPWVVNVGANPIQFVHNVSPMVTHIFSTNMGPETPTAPMRSLCLPLCRPQKDRCWCLMQEDFIHPPVR